MGDDSVSPVKGRLIKIEEETKNANPLVSLTLGIPNLNYHAMMIHLFYQLDHNRKTSSVWAEKISKHLSQTMDQIKSEIFLRQLGYLSQVEGQNLPITTTTNLSRSVTKACSQKKTS